MKTLKTFRFKPVLSSKSDTAKLSVRGFAIAAADNPHEAHILVRDAFNGRSNKDPETPDVRWVFAEELKDLHKSPRVLNLQIAFNNK